MPVNYGLPYNVDPKTNPAPIPDCNTPDGNQLVQDQTVSQQLDKVIDLLTQLVNLNLLILDALDPGSVDTVDLDIPNENT